MVKIIGVCGGSGSGKTTLSKILCEQLGSSASYISMDSYYKDRSHLTEDEIKLVNFDHPESIDIDRIVLDIQAITNNLPIEVPNYCFKTHSRKGVLESISPTLYLILEGLFVFHRSDLRELLDTKIYIHADSDTRLVRRIRRDVVERNRDIKSILTQYESTVRPMFEKFISPQREYADIVLDTNAWNYDQDSINKLIKNIKV
jgi:uridine kinase